MLNRKTNFYVLLMVMFTACTKQELLPTIIQTNAANQSTTATITTFGLVEEDTDYNHTKADMNQAGANTIRLPIILSERTVSKQIDKYLNDGYNVQVNISWFDGINGSRGFPKSKDSNTVKAQADAFFKYYADRKSKIPFVVVENEWDYEVQHGSNLQDYIKELSVINSVGHKYGFKIADGGITSGALQRWTYSQLTGTAQQQWGDKYYVGVNNNYDALMNIVNSFVASAKNINYDYSNVHWYNTVKCGNGFGTASQTYMKACNKKKVMCNEFGIRTNSLPLFTQTVNEITGNTPWAFAYNGSNVKGKAIKLTNAMLQVLK